MTSIQVLPNGDTWKISDGNEFATQEEAIDAARHQLRAQGGGELVIHDEQGQIRAKDTIESSDPREIPG